jgi:hypothetical protein
MTRKTLPGTVVVEVYEGDRGILPLKFDGQWVVPSGDTAAVEDASAEFGRLAAEGEWHNHQNELEALMRERMEVWLKDYVEEIEYKSPSTISQYLAACKKFAQWARENNVESLPARSVITAAYLFERVKDGASAHTIRLASAAIRHAHRMNGHGDPTQDHLVQAVLRYAHVHNKNGHTNGNVHDDLTTETTTEGLH